MIITNTLNTVNSGEQKKLHEHVMCLICITVDYYLFTDLLHLVDSKFSSGWTSIIKCATKYDSDNKNKNLEDIKIHVSMPLKWFRDFSTMVYSDCKCPGNCQII